MQVLCSSAHPELEPAARDWLSRLGDRVVEAHPLAGQVQVVLTDDGEIRRLNAAYRAADTATDVLSFSYSDGLLLPPGAEEAVLGEVYISLERAAVQAAEQGVPLLAECARLMVHGLLHLAGYEHDAEPEMQAMERETDAMLVLAAAPAAGAAPRSPAPGRPSP